MNNSLCEKRKKHFAKKLKLILSEIRSMGFETDFRTPRGWNWWYPDFWVFIDSKFKKNLFELFVKGKLKISGKKTTNDKLCKAIICNTYLFKLGIEINNIFGSRWQIDDLSKLDSSVFGDEMLETFVVLSFMDSSTR